VGKATVDLEKQLTSFLYLKYDLVFIDAELYYQLFCTDFTKRNKGGIILSDNVLWMKRRTKTHKDTDNFLVTAGL
jgi:predicted O-methyltransferase YrrM